MAARRRLRRLRCSTCRSRPAPTRTLIPGGKALPVAVHLFELRYSAKFGRADVFALIEHEKATLGEDDLFSEEFVISPGDKTTMTRTLKPGTQFVGVVVLFRDIDKRHMARRESAGQSQRPDQSEADH